MMLDVHILSMEYTRSDWFFQCLSSVYTAAANAPYEVRVHILPGVVGHLGQARAAGYSIGSAPYATHVDDDDYLDPDAFSLLAPALGQGVEAITTGERQWILDLDKSYDLPDSRHHLAIYRRDVLEQSDYPEFRYHPDQRLLSQVNPLHLPQCVYNCRVYDQSGSRVQRRQDPEGAKAEMARIRKPSLFVAEAHSPAQIAAMLEQI